MTSRTTASKPIASQYTTVKYCGEEYDVGNILNIHPGGQELIEQFIGKDVTSVMNPECGSVHKHSREAIYLLRNSRQLPNEIESSRGCDDAGESLEYLVDCTRSVTSQVGNLGAKYHTWVCLPVNKNFRLFDNAILEFLSKTHWYFVPLIWIPVAGYIFEIGCLTAPVDTTSYMLSICFLVGVLYFSLIEYVLHRWLLHSLPPADSPILTAFHFLIHGYHHKVPFDGMRLVFPPVGVVLVGLFLYLLLLFPFPTWLSCAVASGALIGYVIYDLTHYYLHHGQPKEGSFLHNLQRRHLFHHFSHQSQGYGVSSPFWDIIFGTNIKLTKWHNILIKNSDKKEL